MNTINAFINKLPGYWNQLVAIIDEYLTRFFDMVAPNGNYSIYKYAIGGLLFLGFFLLIFHIGKNNVLKQAYQSTYEKLVKKKIKSNKEIYDLKEKVVNPVTTYLNSKFVYSGLDKHIKFLTPELFIGFVIILFLVVFLILLFTKTDILVSFGIALVAAFMPFLIQAIMAQRNYKKTDKQLVEFLNMIGNFSVSSGEVTDVFMHVYPMLEEPISSALEECVYEAENIGTEQALINLTRKIEHPKFKEIIQNLRVSQKYSGNFRSVVENNNASLIEYIKQKRERDHLATFNMITLVIVLVLTVVIFFVLGKMVNTDVFNYLLTTTTGQICGLVAIGCVGFFIWKIYTIDK